MATDAQTTAEFYATPRGAMVAGINPSDFTIFSVVERKVDPWKNIFEKKVKLEI